jgi:peptide/nickel transport system permease protein
MRLERLMLVFVARRLASAVLLAFVLTLITFVMFFVLPEDHRPIQGGQASFVPDLQTQFHAEGSFVEQYGRFLEGVVLYGDLGDSFRSGKPVTTVIGQTLPVTASLVFGGVVFWLAMAFPIGLLSALHPRSLLDRGLMLFVLLGLCAHPVWLGLMFSWLFGVKLRWLPVAGYCDLRYDPESTNPCGGPRYWAYHMILPWLTFAFLFAALYARMIRAGVLEVLGEDYVRTARAKGAGTFRVMRGHVLRNAMLPVITMIGMDIGIAFGGTLFIETVFDLPGMGQLLVSSLGGPDLPVIMGIVLTVSFAVVIANLIVDLLVPLVDPRVRLYGKGGASARAPRRRLRARPRVTSESPTT